MTTRAFDEDKLIHSRIDGNGPKLLLLHPVGLDLTFWDAVTSLLARQFTILRTDMKGHGKSPSVDPEARLEDYAEDIHNLLADRAFGPTAVVGLSFGGMLAQTLALNFPGDVSALAICGCGGTFAPEVRIALRERGTAARTGGMQAVVDTTLTRWFSSGFIASGGAESTRRRLLSDDVDGWTAAWNAISYHDAVPRLAEIRVPTLCLAGAADVSAPPPVLKAMADVIQGARFEILPDAPHMMQIERADRFAEAIADFLQSPPVVSAR